MVQAERKDRDTASTQRGWPAFAEHIGRSKIFPKNRFRKLHHSETTGSRDRSKDELFSVLSYRDFKEKKKRKKEKKRSWLVQNKGLEKADSRHESLAHPG